MDIEQALTAILERLTAIEKRLDAVPDTLEMHGLIATTASHEDVSDLSDTLDYLVDQIEEGDKQRTLTEIRQSLRAARAS